ncbi:interferon gamma related isoform X1 [Colossoma macropomum]|uniref:interferon gamma related isoform X1 n=1 Tax=Colossoma macropomum TaxID=42526 RepID=UPI001865149E|nr:interferon gamma related isoform X1 [Colossoma macropomum]
MRKPSGFSYCTERNKAIRMDSWFSLVLMCGLVIIESLNGAAGNVIPHNVPHNPLQNLKKAVHTVQKYYDLKNKEWMGRAVFAPYLGKTEVSLTILLTVEQSQERQSIALIMLCCFKTCTCEKLVLAAMLNSYVEIFSDMMKKSKEIEASLKGMQANVTHLQESKYSKEQHVLTQLQEIKHKNVNDMTIQGGAVNDFLSVYDMASH